MTYRAITYEVRDGTGLLTLDRPAQRNALDLDMREEISDVVARVRREGAIHALVITGAGGAFCAGGDLKALTESERPVPVNRERIRRLHTWFAELVNLEFPVIAAVDGPAFGAGFNLALAADFILCSPAARFCAVFVRIGLVPDLGGFFLLPRIVGLQRAKEIILTGRVVEPPEAVALGIVHSVHPAGELLDRALEFAGRFRHASAPALGMAKNILNQSFHLDQHALAEMEAYAQAVALATEGHRKAVADFLEKKPLAFDWNRLSGSGERS